jgi:hypothetical protein
MQPLFASPDDPGPVLSAIVQPERLVRYIRTAQGNAVLARALYVWNCRLCQSFYTPLHYAEISCRNALNHRLMARFGTAPADAFWALADLLEIAGATELVITSSEAE